MRDWNKTWLVNSFSWRSFPPWQSSCESTVTTSWFWIYHNVMYSQFLIYLTIPECDLCCINPQDRDPWRGGMWRFLLQGSSQLRNINSNSNSGGNNSNSNSNSNLQNINSSSSGFQLQLQLWQISRISTQSLEVSTPNPTPTPEFQFHPNSISNPILLIQLNQ